MWPGAATLVPLEATFSKGGTPPPLSLRVEYFQYARQMTDVNRKSWYDNGVGRRLGPQRAQGQ